LETDATRMCALLVGLPDVVVVGVGEWPQWLSITVTIVGERPACVCGGAVHRHGIRKVVLVDLPAFGRPTRLAWRKQRWRCSACGRCWCDEHPEIATARCTVDDAGGALGDGAGRPPRTCRQRCRPRSRVWVACGDGRRRRRR